jgi:hypothetical protein
MLTDFWGLNAVAFLQPRDFLLLIPQVLAGTIYILGSYKFPNHFKLFAILWFVVNGAAFFILSAQTTFLGDGAALLSFLKTNTVYYPSNLLDYQLHRLLYNSLLSPSGYEPLMAYTVFSGLAGIIFLLSMLDIINCYCYFHFSIFNNRIQLPWIFKNA